MRRGSLQFHPRLGHHSDLAVLHQHLSRGRRIMEGRLQRIRPPAAGPSPHHSRPKRHPLKTLGLGLFRLFNLKEVVVPTLERAQVSLMELGYGTLMTALEEHAKSGFRSLAMGYPSRRALNSTVNQVLTESPQYVARCLGI
jgi:hypothetical protein